MDPSDIILWAVCLGVGWLIIASLTGADEWLKSLLGKNKTGEKSPRSDPELAPSDPDEVAARVFGEGLRLAEVSLAASEEAAAAFWAADPPNRRALAHMVAAMSADGPLDDEKILLVMVRSLRTMTESTAAADKKQLTSTDFSELPIARKE